MNEPFVIDGKTLVAEIQDGGYDWSLYAIFADDAGRLFSTSDYGCSCTYPYEDPASMEWTPLTNIQDAIAEARRWSTGTSSKDVEDFISDLMAYRAPKAGI